MAEMRSARDLAGRARARVAGGGRVRRLEQRVAELEAEVQECRQLNLRLAEITDVVEQLLLPAARQDHEALEAALERYTRTV